MTVSPQNDLSYLGVRAPNPPNQIVAANAPTTNDYRFPIGTLWLDDVANTSWQLTHVAGTTATWTALGTGAVGGIVTITGDTGGAESPLVGNFSLLGTANQVKVTGAANKETFSLIGPYTPATYTSHGVLTGAGTGSIVATAAGTNGQALLGSTGAVPAFGTITSANSSITFTTGAASLAMAVTQATTTQLGGATFATNAETEAGTVTNKFITPANLAFVKSSMDVDVSLTNPVLQSILTTGAAPSGATGATNIMMFQSGWTWEQFILGAGQTIIAPRIGASGLLISLDLTATEGAEYNSGARLNSPLSFTIGTSAAFFLEIPLLAADVTGCDPLLIGFRKVEANNATFVSYTDYASIGLSATDGANIWIRTILNAGAETKTDTTDAWTDGQTKTLRINVSAAGVVTYLINGIAPVVTAAFTFDATDVVIPFIRLEHAAVAPGAIDITGRLKCGLQ